MVNISFLTLHTVDVLNIQELFRKEINLYKSENAIKIIDAKIDHNVRTTAPSNKCTRI